MPGLPALAFGALALAATPAAPPAARLETPALAVAIRGAEIVDVRLGSSRVRNRSLPAIRALGPEDWQASARTRVRKAQSTVTVTGLDVWRAETVELPAARAGSEAALLERGHTFTQAFVVPPAAQCMSVAAHIPTWHSTTSRALLTVERDGREVARTSLRSIKDNSWPQVRPARPLPPGEYVLRLSAPVGMVGWWGDPATVTPGCPAGADGRVTPGTRDTRLSLRHREGDGTLTVRAAGDVVTVTAACSTPAPPPAGPLRWRWRAGWRQEGYDCTPAAGIPFRAFYTDNQRYMPVEQLRRRRTAGLTFTGSKWMQARCHQGGDLRVAAPDLTATWEMAPREISMRLTTRRTAMPGGWRAKCTLSARPLAEELPPGFPRIRLSDRRAGEDLDRMWLERGFTYPGPAGPAAWFEWMPTMRAWFAGPARAGEMQQLRTYPITAEGYVHTWGDDPGWPLRPTPDTDTRHFDTNARFVLGCWRMYSFTGDLVFLRAQADRVRRAMRFQLDTLRGREGLIVTVSKDVTGRHGAHGNNYWDILPFGHLDAYANAVFYASLEAAAHIERALGARATEDWAALRRKTRDAYNAAFWDEAKGRYLGCIDADGARHDYGFTFLNLEAAHYGLADAAQVRRIYRWMETEPTSSGKADTYSKWQFAPRATTLHNPPWNPDKPEPTPAGKTPSWWVVWWRGTRFGDQCQDGGAILYTSFFDLMARSRYLGADNAWERMQGILTRYRMPDRLCGGNPLYRGERPQQEDAGSVGVDLPFPESGLVPCYVVYGLLGVHASDEGLRIQPKLPRALQWAEVEGIDWRGMRLTVRVTRNSVAVTMAGSARPRTYRIRPGGLVVLPPPTP